jgi:hypothetical protein
MLRWMEVILFIGGDVAISEDMAVEQLEINGKTKHG